MAQVRTEAGVIDTQNFQIAREIDRLDLMPMEDIDRILFTLIQEIESMEAQMRRFGDERPDWYRRCQDALRIRNQNVEKLKTYISDRRREDDYVCFFEAARASLDASTFDEILKKARQYATN